MGRSTCKVVVRLKPKDDPLDTAVQAIDNSAVIMSLVLSRSFICAASAATEEAVRLQNPTLLVKKGTDDEGLYQVCCIRLTASLSRFPNRQTSYDRYLCTVTVIIEACGPAYSSNKFAATLTLSCIAVQLYQSPECNFTRLYS